jgi:hypothetical protein
LSLAAEIDPRFVDLALALILLEAVGLTTYHALTGRGPAPIGTIANLLAGGFLVLVLREMLCGASPFWVIASFTSALIAHGVDLAIRWNSRGVSPFGPRITRGAITLTATRRQMNPAPKTSELATKEWERPRA